MRVMIVPHIGETLGHLARAISIAKELLASGVEVEFVSSPRARYWIEAANLKCTLTDVRWNWSHNSAEPDGLSSSFLGYVVETITDLTNVLKARKPDFILGMPGFATVQLARQFEIPHASVIHGTHLAPLVELSDPTDEETAVIRLTTKMCLGPLNNAFAVVSRLFGLPQLSYEDFLHTERIFIPQPQLPVILPSNIATIPFIRASLGPPCELSDHVLRDACFVTFGSGNPCDTARLLRLTHQIFSTVVANTGALPMTSLGAGIHIRPFISSFSLAGRVKLVVSHGGIGTIGTFAESGTRQMIIPTELDQANMAIHAARSKIATHFALNSVASRTTLGRRLPDFADQDFMASLFKLKSMPQPNHFSATGAQQIAASISALQLAMRPRLRPA